MILAMVAKIYFKSVYVVDISGMSIETDYYISNLSEGIWVNNANK